MLNVNSNLFKFNKISIKLISSSLLAGIALINGFVPEVSGRSPSFSINAYAQEFTPDEIENYAKAGYEVELLRREVYKEIKTLIKEPPPNIVCDRQETLQGLDEAVRAIAVDYCDRSRQIVEENNLTISRFNELKTYYDRRDSFYQQVQNALLKLQS